MTITLFKSSRDTEQKPFLHLYIKLLLKNYQPHAFRQDNQSLLAEASYQMGHKVHIEYVIPVVHRSVTHFLRAKFQLAILNILGNFVAKATVNTSNPDNIPLLSSHSLFQTNNFRKLLQIISLNHTYYFYIMCNVHEPT
jgi:hypothetical protein